MFSVILEGEEPRKRGQEKEKRKKCSCTIKV